MIKRMYSSFKWCIILKKSKMRLATGFEQMGHIYVNYMSGGNRRLLEVVEMPYWRQQSFDDSLIFAKCIHNQHFLISILPSGLLLWLEGKMLTKQHFLSAFYPHWLVWSLKSIIRGNCAKSGREAEFLGKYA